MTKWFGFKQNNSGGSFDHDPESGIGYAIYVEADDAEHANYRAKRIGLYFNGCASGRDCSCCGDRWSEATAEVRELQYWTEIANTIIKLAQVIGNLTIGGKTGKLS